MAIEFRCDQCSKLLRTTDDKAGANAKCPQCGTQVTVPSPAPADEYAGLYEDEPAAPPPRRRSSAGGPASPWPFDPAEGGASRPAPRHGALRPCPMCGEQIQAAATRCKFCGETLSATPSSYGRTSSLKPHRGGLILAFGILGWTVCLIFGILAAVMGNEDLKEMEAGRMDPSGHGMTQAGKIIGLIQCVLAGIGILLFCALMVIGVVADAN